MSCYVAKRAVHNQSVNGLDTGRSSSSLSVFCDFVSSATPVAQAVSVSCTTMTSPPRPFPNPADGLLLGGIFTGIGGWEIAAGKDWTRTFTAEMDKHARKVFEANFGSAPDVGDIMSAPASAAKFAHVYTVS